MIAIVRLQRDDIAYRRTIAGIYVLLVSVLLAASAADDRFHPLVTQSRFALVSATMFLACLHANPDGLFLAALEWRPLDYLGRISYGVYLFHMPVYFLVAHSSDKLGNGYAMFGALALAKMAGTIAVASISFAFLERPALRLESKWSKRLASQTAVC